MRHKKISQGVLSVIENIAPVFDVEGRGTGQGPWTVPVFIFPAVFCCWIVA
jgi:hypothetical protein